MDHSLKAAIERKKLKYRIGSMYFFYVTKSVAATLGHTLVATTRERMAEVFEAIAEIDYLLDNDVNVAPTLEKRRKELMEGDGQLDLFKDSGFEETFGNTNYIYQTLNRLGGINRYILEITYGILECQKVMGKTESIDEFIKARNKEGHLSMLFLLKYLESYNLSQETINSIIPLGVNGNLYDSIVDFEKDYANGEIKVKPSLHNKVSLYREVLVGLPSMFQILSGCKEIRSFLFKRIKYEIGKKFGLTKNNYGTAEYFSRFHPDQIHVSFDTTSII